MTDTPQTPDAQTPEVPLTKDDLWKAVLAMAEPLAQLIAAKREQFRIASNSAHLEQIYREDALKQATRLSEAEVFLCNGLQIFKQALAVGYPMPDEMKTKPSSLIEQLSQLPASTLVN